MKLARPLSLSLSYVRERIAPYAKLLRDRRDVIATSAISFLVGALSIIAVSAAARVTEEVRLLTTLAASSASSAAHGFEHEMGALLYAVRCALVAHVKPLSILATAIGAMICGRALARRTMRAVREIEASRERIYAIVVDKFADCPKCAHKMTCAFHSYERLEVTAERARADLGVDFYALQVEAMHHAARRRRRPPLPEWERVCEVFRAPTGPTIDVEPASVKTTVAA